MHTKNRAAIYYYPLRLDFIKAKRAMLSSNKLPSEELLTEDETDLLYFTQLRNH